MSFALLLKTYIQTDIYWLRIYIYMINEVHRSMFVLLGNAFGIPNKRSWYTLGRTYLLALSRPVYF